MRWKIGLVFATTFFGSIHAATLETGTLQFTFPDAFVQQRDTTSILLVGPSGQRVRLSSISFRGNESEVPAWLEGISRKGHDLAILEGASHGFHLSEPERSISLSSGAKGVLVASVNEEKKLCFVQYLLGNARTSVYLTLETGESLQDAQIEALALAGGLKWK